MPYDLAHFRGGDLSLSATGDLLAVTGTDLTTQRVLRRLLTNPGDYIWHLEYGAGLPAYVGQPASPTRIGAVIRAQMRKEAAVGRTPPPAIGVQARPDGTVTASVQYADATTGQTATFTVPAGG